jgi:hypothetical protein
MITTAAPIIKIVVNPKRLDIFPFVLACNIFFVVCYSHKSNKSGYRNNPIYNSSIYQSLNGIDTDEVDS